MTNRLHRDRTKADTGAQGWGEDDVENELNREEADSEAAGDNVDDGLDIGAWAEDVDGEIVSEDADGVADGEEEAVGGHDEDGDVEVSLWTAQVCLCMFADCVSTYVFECTWGLSCLRWHLSMIHNCLHYWLRAFPYLL